MDLASLITSDSTDSRRPSPPESRPPSSRTRTFAECQEKNAPNSYFPSMNFTQSPRAPLSPPAEDQPKCSLPSISTLLEGVDCALPPAKRHRPNPSQSNEPSSRMFLPPTPPLHSTGDSAGQTLSIVINLILLALSLYVQQQQCYQLDESAAAADTASTHYDVTANAIIRAALHFPGVTHFQCSLCIARTEHGLLHLVRRAAGSVSGEKSSQLVPGPERGTTCSGHAAIVPCTDDLAGDSGMAAPPLLPAVQLGAVSAEPRPLRVPDLPQGLLAAVESPHPLAQPHGREALPVHACGVWQGV
ncbi:hypothetical protein T310_7038 [Rasamsonia emersonii CBS 393.64]|uniref:Uncharacterized protein n=1 Tax=Rasamsonia emersonii (strain ATCC 16479 / CBS 393.64 / IMI 116815) TaxID=1408163 RepID=A0A0F4YLL1_RASE3|nr:hypothetical protein T310_7038 [Rasamsonia emersonii CBS 393.64]KKA19010.1 hypothetical protein T310_7038 [Rasamsonia emersonii CBS 393.64]